MQDSGTTESVGAITPALKGDKLPSEAVAVTKKAWPSSPVINFFTESTRVRSKTRVQKIYPGEAGWGLLVPRYPQDQW